jgi:hypothetical protein
MRNCGRYMRLQIDLSPLRPFSSGNNQPSSELTGRPLAPLPPVPLVAKFFGLPLSIIAQPIFFSSIRPMSNTALSIMPRSAKEQLAERRVQQKLDGAIAFTEYQSKEQATRLLTAKLRAERLARESKPRRKREAKSSI